MYALVLTYTKPLETVQQFTAAHREYLDRFVASGNLLVSGRQNPPVGGLVVASFASRAEVDAFIANDPFIVNGVASYAPIEFAAIKHQPAIKDWLTARGEVK